MSGRPLTILLGVLLTTQLAVARPLGAPAAEINAALDALSRPLRDPADLTPLIDAAGAARAVLLGESTHGTREFGSWRDLLSRRLIAERGFSFVAIEGDRSSLAPLDRYVRGMPGAASSACAALQRIERWPRWAWVNPELARFGEWLHDFNRGRPFNRRIGVYGIDLHALWDSADAVEAFYTRHLPQLAAHVVQRYASLQRFRDRYQGYADHVRATGGSARIGAAEVAADLSQRYAGAPAREREMLFEVLLHAVVVAAGERFLCQLTWPPWYAWNTRAVHFDDMLARLLAHHGARGRGIVWAHNSHIGDARATLDPTRPNEISFGELARMHLGAGRVFSIGFGTALGSVRAAREWEGPDEVMRLQRPRADSIEAALLDSGGGDRFMVFDPPSPVAQALGRVIPQRAIGVVYEPHDEARKHYVPARLSARYDAFVFVPLSHASEPLPRACADGRVRSSVSPAPPGTSSRSP